MFINDSTFTLQKPLIGVFKILFSFGLWPPLGLLASWYIYTQHSLLWFPCFLFHFFPKAQFLLFRIFEAIKINKKYEAKYCYGVKHAPCLNQTVGLGIEGALTENRIAWLHGFTFMIYVQYNWTNTLAFRLQVQSKISIYKNKKIKKNNNNNNNNNNLRYIQHFFQ